jgi:hypothetical protein
MWFIPYPSGPKRDKRHDEGNCIKWDYVICILLEVSLELLIPTG